MPDISDRERGIAAYAGEVRAFHAFLGAVLILLAVLHLFVLLPYMQLRIAAPALASATADAEREVTATQEAVKAVKTATAALVQFRRVLEAMPAEVRRTIGGVVARGQLDARPKTDPYRVTIGIPKDAGTPAGRAPGEQVVPLEETVRRQIGRQTEALSTAFDAALEPLRPLAPPLPEVIDVIRAAEEGVGRNVLELNEVLREAFAADPGFWRRLGVANGLFAGASARAAEWDKRTAEALRLLEGRLAAAAVTLKGRERAAQARVTILTERNRELRERLAAFSARLSWLPLGLEGWARLYPIVAGGLAVTVLFRLRRLLLLRKALGGVDLDLMAPSWVLGASTVPGRGWAMLLVALPVVATIHASLASLDDPGLYATLLGEPSPARWGVYAVIYAALIGTGIWQLVLVGRSVFVPQSKRQGAQPGGAARN